jgi:hypothetical protein
VVRVFRELGLLSELEERQWTQRINRAADPDAPPLQTQRARAQTSPDVASRAAPPVPQTTPPPVHRWPHCSKQTLLDVLMVRAGAEDSIRLDFIERYADGFAANWTGSTPHGSHTPPILRARATDDLGTSYVSTGGNRHSLSEDRFAGNNVVAPAIPAEASELHVSIGDDGFIIVLPKP